jgi:hypothetical protein
MFFDYLDERNAMVKFVTYFDNFIKWTLLVVNSPLSHDNSKKHFYTRLCGGEDKCPAHHPEEASEKILGKCGSVPLAMITMASLLVGKSREVWFDVCRSPGFHHSRDNKQVDDTMWIFSVSYHDLPSHLNTYLLYLSVYPEDL